MKHHTTTVQLCQIDGCGRETGDVAYVCGECGAALARLLAILPMLEAALDDLTARPQTVTAHLPADDHDPARHPAETGPVRLPYRYTTSEARWELRDCLTSWADDTARRRGLFRPLNTLAALGPWLVAQVTWLRHQPHGPQAIDEMTAALRHALRTIDRPADRIFAGPCTATAGDEDPAPCDGWLYARPGARTVECPACGASYDVDARRAWMLEQIEDRMYSVPELATVLPGLGVPVTRDQIYGLVTRKMLLPSTVRDGRKLFTPRHVIDQLRRVATARTPKETPA